MNKRNLDQWVAQSLGQLDAENPDRPWNDAKPSTEEERAVNATGIDFNLASNMWGPIGGELRARLVAAIQRPSKQPLRTAMGPYVREILEYADGWRRVFVFVQDGPDAVNVLEAIREAYQDGRDDFHAEDIEAAEKADLHGPECTDEEEAAQ